VGALNRKRRLPRKNRKASAKTSARYLEHLADDVLPVILRQAFAIARETEKQ
jgi:hypothetical protein